MLPSTQVVLCYQLERWLFWHFQERAPGACPANPGKQGRKARVKEKPYSRKPSQTSQKWRVSIFSQPIPYGLRSPSRLYSCTTRVLGQSPPSSPLQGGSKCGYIYQCAQTGFLPFHLYSLSKMSSHSSESDNTARQKGRFSYIRFQFLSFANQPKWDRQFERQRLEVSYHYC